MNNEDIISVFTEFSGMDWSAYSGAKPFIDGSEPLICYECLYVEDKELNLVIIDGYGIGIYYIDEDGDLNGVFTKEKKFDYKEEALGYFIGLVKTNEGLITRDFLNKNFDSQY